MVPTVTLLLMAVQEVEEVTMEASELELPDKEITAALLFRMLTVVVVVLVLSEEMQHQAPQQETVVQAFSAHYHPLARPLTAHITGLEVVAALMQIPLLARVVWVESVVAVAVQLMAAPQAQAVEVR